MPQVRVRNVLDTQETGNIETGEAMAEEESLQEQLDAALEQVEKDKRFTPSTS